MWLDGARVEVDVASPKTRLQHLLGLRAKWRDATRITWGSGELSAILLQLQPALLDFGGAELVVEILGFLLDLQRAEEAGTGAEEGERDGMAPTRLDSLLAGMLPDIIHCLSHPKSSIKRQSARLLEAIALVQAKEVFSALIYHGLDHDDMRIRRESAECLCHLFTKNCRGIGVDRLLEHLIFRLCDVSEVVVHTAAKALAHIRQVLGDAGWAEVVQRLPGSPRRILAQHEVSSSSSSVSGAGLSTKGPVLSSASLAGEEGAKVSTTTLLGSGFTHRLDRGERRAEDVTSPQPPLPPPGLHLRMSQAEMHVVGQEIKTSSPASAVVCGFLPSAVVCALKSGTDWRSRAAAIDSVHRLILEQEDFQPHLTHLAELLDLLLEVMEDINFKTVLQALQSISDVLAKVGSMVRPHMLRLMDQLVRKLADSKQHIRQRVTRILLQLMQVLRPKAVLERIGQLLHTTHHARVQEELVNTINSALLLLPEHGMSEGELLQHLVPLIRDGKARIKYVALEAVAIIIAAHAGTPGHVAASLSNLDGLDEECTRVILSRLEDPSLPVLGPEGLVEYAFSRSHTGTPRPPTSMSAITLVPSLSSSTGSLEAGWLTTRSTLPFRSPSHSASDHRHRASHASSPATLRHLSCESVQSNASITLEACGGSLNQVRVLGGSRFGVASITSKMPWERQSSLSRSSLAPSPGVARGLDGTTPMPVMACARMEETQPQLIQQFHGTHALPELSGSLESFQLPGHSRSGSEHSAHDLEVRACKAHVESQDSPRSTTLTPRSPSQPGPLPTKAVAKNLPAGRHHKAKGRIASPASTSPGPTSPSRRDALPATEETSFTPTRARVRPVQDDGPVSPGASPVPHEEGLGTSTTLEVRVPPPSGDAKAPKTAPASPKRTIATTRTKVGRSTPFLATAPKPPSVPVPDIGALVQKLKGAVEWEETAEALTSITELARTKPGALTRELHDLTLAVVEEVTNLRSSVAKPAILCVRELLEQCGPAMDPDLNLIVAALLRKVGEGNQFLIGEIDRALATLVRTTTPLKALGALIASTNHKSSVIRAKISAHTYQLLVGMSASQVQRTFATQTECERILHHLRVYSREGAAETRNAAKLALAHVSRAFPDFDRLVSKYLSIRDAEEIREAIQSSAKVGKLGSKNSLAGSRKSLEGGGGSNGSQQGGILGMPASTSRRGSTKEGGMLPQLQEQLQEIRGRLRSDDWKVRFDTLGALGTFVQEHHGQMQERPILQPFLDSILDRCREGNSKVACLALTHLHQMIPLFRDSVDSAMIGSLVTMLAAHFASGNAQIKDLAKDTLDSMIVHYDACALGAPLISIVQFGGNVKVRPIALEKLSALVPALLQQQQQPLPPGGGQGPAFIRKHLLPLGLELLQRETKGEAKVANHRLLEALHAGLGWDGLAAQANPEQRAKLATLLAVPKGPR